MATKLNHLSNVPARRGDKTCQSIKPENPTKRRRLTPLAKKWDDNKSGTILSGKWFIKCPKRCAACDNNPWLRAEAVATGFNPENVHRMENNGRDRQEVMSQSNSAVYICPIANILQEYCRMHGTQFPARKCFVDIFTKKVGKTTYVSMYCTSPSLLSHLYPLGITAMVAYKHRNLYCLLFQLICGTPMSVRICRLPMP